MTSAEFYRICQRSLPSARLSSCQYRLHTFLYAIPRLLGRRHQYLCSLRSATGWHSSQFKQFIVQDPIESAEPLVESIEVHSYAPSSPANHNPTLFPGSVSSPGPTPSGAESALMLQPLPIRSAPWLKVSSSSPKSSHPTNLSCSRSGGRSPWYSNR